MQFTDSEGIRLEASLIFINDLESMVNVVCVARNIDINECEVMIGIDGGKGRLLTTLTISHHDQNVKWSRAKRTIVLACVPENYEINT